VRPSRRGLAALRLPPPVVLLVFLVPACGDGSGPAGESFSGTYDLVSVDGRGLPVVLAAGLSGPSRVLTGGSLVVRGRGRVLDVRHFQLGAGSAAPRESDSTTYAYSLDGGRLLVQRPRIQAATSHVDTGTVSGNVVTLGVRFIVVQDLAPTSGTLLYRKTP
jgi:hypothetical protein